jgi:hypothetical protein
MWCSEIKSLHILITVKALQYTVCAKLKILTLQLGCNYMVIIVTTMLE